MLRLTETRGSRAWPASFQAAREARVWAACWTWKASPVSSFFRVELCRFIPSFAAQIAVAFEPAPHQILSRRLSECGSRRSRRGGLGNIGFGFGRAKPSPRQEVKEHLRMTPPHVGIGLAL